MIIMDKRNKKHYHLLYSIYSRANHKETRESRELKLSIMDTYKILLEILSLPLMSLLAAVLLTSKVGFSAADAVSGLKLIERGVPKNKLAMLVIPVIPLQLVLPWIINTYIVGQRPMDVFLKAMPPRLLMGLVYVWIVWATPSFQEPNGEFPLYYYVMIVSIYLVHQFFVCSMFVSVMVFFASISDPAVGGTYMTFLNTVANFGSRWPSTLALWLVDILTYKKCDISLVDEFEYGNITNKEVNELKDNTCLGKDETIACEKIGGKCETEMEGYYVESIICIGFGLLWLGLWGWRATNRIQSASKEDWRVVTKTKKRQF